MQSPSNSQVKAIKHGEGAMLVLAGPGSGKTFVIIQRILNLIHEKQVRPDDILVISFSKASTLELKQRFQRESKEQVNFSTFHACFFHILKETYHYTSRDIITEKQKRELLKLILFNFDCQNEEVTKIQNQEKIKSITEKTEDYLQKIAYYKNKGIRELKEKESKQFQQIFQEYNQEMHQRHKLDFDDMGLLCLQLFQNRPDILEKWQEKFRYILIDEFQDINMVQFRIVQFLAMKYQNLFVVGDDDQSIYGFRGSNPQIMLDFEKYYPKTQKVLLETNYRCSEEIVRESLKVIEQNKVRLKKEIKAFHDNNPESYNKNESTSEKYKIDYEKLPESKKVLMKNTGIKKAVVYQGFENYQKEYFYIGEKIKQFVQEESYQYSDIACIFRTNQDMSGLAEYLARNKIPFVMKESCNSIFQHFIALDISAYLQFFLEGKKRSDFFRIMNKPLRYLSRNALSSLSEETVNWRDLKEYYSSKKYMVNNFEQLEQNEKWIQKLDLYGACFYIRKVIGYEQYLKEYVKEQNLNWEEAKEILDFIQESTRNKTLEEWKEYIEQYEEALKSSGEEKEGVHIITMHACKGMEYPIVFLPDCNEGKIPHKKAVAKEEIEEERRMFYVAMTRAKYYLEILYIEDKQKKHLQHTRFIEHYKKSNRG